MLFINNKSETVIIVLHEIYGINQHIRLVCDRFSMKGYDVICPNLINTEEPFDYNQEEVAYQHFVENIGLEPARRKTRALVIQARKQYKHVFLVGYSIGATIAWLSSTENKGIDGAVGYYGSRIRDYLDVTPKCPVSLLFAAEEKSFDVERLISSLSKTGVDTHIFKGDHGFSDPFNKNYCELSSKNSETITDSFINKIKAKY